MKLDIPTLACMLGVIFATLVVALAVQFRVNRAYRGIGWWLAGSVLTALGFLFLAGSEAPALRPLGPLGNPLLVAGRLSIWVGVAAFLDRKGRLWLLTALLLVFLAVYYFYLLVAPSLPARTIIVSAAIALISFATAGLLLLHRQPEISASLRFTAMVFLVHGGFLLLNIYTTLQAPHIANYGEYSSIQRGVFVVPIVTSTLWTFGLILMVNQRLNADNLAEKGKLQQALDALKDSEETYRSILNASPDDITITDLEGTVLIVSPAANTMFGYTPGQAIGMNVLTFLVPEDRSRARANLRLMIQGTLEGPNDYRGLRRDGSQFDIEVNSGLSFGARCFPAKLVFVVRDITGRKRVESEKAALAVRNRQLQKSESLGRMAGAIAHHFNNKLQTVLSNLELMENQSAQARAIYLERAREATEGASEVSRLMLAYLGQTSHEQVPLGLAGLCRDSLALLKGTLPTRVALRAELPAAGPEILGNGNQLQQVVVNLVTNAWEALGETGGDIRLGLDTCPATAISGVHRVPVDWQPQAETYACLEVADTGSGIPAADLDKLFDPFFSTRFTGRGMGLSVVLGIVQAHGGGLVVESRPRQGSVFRVYLPLNSEAPQAVPEPAPAALAVVGHGTLLVVEDDPSLLEGTCELLKGMGFSVLAARDGVEALEVFDAHPGLIRCVITDLTMPRLDGWGTLTALRQRDPALPVILASGYDRGQVMAGEHPERPQVFLGKPFRVKQLQEAVGLALGGAPSPEWSQA